MKRNYYPFFALLLIFILLSKSHSQVFDKSNPWTEKIGIYFPLNYRQHSNKTKWADSKFNGKGDKHYLRMFGVGMKYYPKQSLFFDVSYKRLAMPTTIGELNYTPSNNHYSSSMLSLSAYTLIVNYSRSFSNRLKFYAGIGGVFNDIVIAYWGISSIANPFYTQFYTGIVRSGVEYQITQRCVFSLSVGYESSRNISYVSSDGHVLEYDYKSPFFIEPAITLYF